MKVSPKPGKIEVTVEAGQSSPTLLSERIAPWSRRIAALVLDLVIAYFIASLIVEITVKSEFPGFYSAVVLIIMYTFFTAVYMQTPGMRVMKIACVSYTTGQRIGFWNSFVRAILLQLIVPAVIVDKERRGIHDRVTGSVVISTR